MVSRGASSNRTVYVVLKTTRRVEIQLLHKEGRITNPSFFDTKYATFFTQSYVKAKEMYDKLYLGIYSGHYNLSKQIIKTSFDKDLSIRGCSSEEVVLEETDLECVNHYSVERMRNFVTAGYITESLVEFEDEEEEDIDIYADEGPYDNYRPLYVVMLRKRFIDLQILSKRQLLEDVRTHDDAECIVAITRNSLKARQLEVQYDLDTYYPEGRCFVIERRTVKIALDYKFSIEDGLINQTCENHEEDGENQVDDMSLAQLGRLLSQ